MTKKWFATFPLNSKHFLEKIFERLFINLTGAEKANLGSLSFFPLQWSHKLLGHCAPHKFGKLCWISLGILKPNTSPEMAANGLSLKFKWGKLLFRFFHRCENFWPLWINERKTLMMAFGIPVTLSVEWDRLFVILSSGLRCTAFAKSFAWTLDGFNFFQSLLSTI